MSGNCGGGSGSNFWTDNGAGAIYNDTSKVLVGTASDDSTGATIQSEGAINTHAGYMVNGTAGLSDTTSYAVCPTGNIISIYACNDASCSCSLTSSCTQVDACSTGTWHTVQTSGGLTVG